MNRSIFQRLIPFGAALLAARFGQKRVDQTPVVVDESNRIVTEKPRGSSAFGAIASTALSEAFLPKQTSILGRIMAAAVPVAAARYLRK